MNDSINPEDHALIESTRKVNKVLSMFVMALQEQSRPPTESQFSVAAMLTTLADDIRERAATQSAKRHTAITQIEAPSRASISHR